jgi:hypothetical protein
VIILAAFPIGMILQLLAQRIAFPGLAQWPFPLFTLSAWLTYAVAALLIFAAWRAPAYAEASLQSLASGFE